VSPPAESATLELRDIRGPSAFGGEWRRFWNLIWLTALAEYKTRYLHSWLGYSWSLLRPLLLFAVLYVVFSQVIRFGGQVEDYPALLLFNIMLFQFFSDGTGAAVRCVAQRESLVRKMQFPRIVIPLSVVLTALLTTIMNMIAALLLITAIGVEPRLTWLLLPVVLLVLMVLITGTALALSALFPRFRDVEQIWGVFTRALFYGTPILYPIEFVPEGFRSAVAAANPLVPIFEQARIWVIDPNAPSVVEAAGGPVGVAIAAAIIVATCAFGLRLFEREAPRVAEEL
jgi:ABC-2 type transport system permease protein